MIVHVHIPPGTYEDGEVVRGRFASGDTDTTIMVEATGDPKRRMTLDELNERMEASRIKFEYRNEFLNQF